MLQPSYFFVCDKIQKVVLRIVAPQGTILYTKEMTLAAGSTTVNLPEVANYTSGLYTLHVISTETAKSLGVFRFVIR